MGAHLVDGQFQSDKYPTCPPGKVPLSVKDETAQDLLWEYAQRRRVVDAEFSDDLESALRAVGYTPQKTECARCGRTRLDWNVSGGTCTEPVQGGHEWVTPIKKVTP